MSERDYILGTHDAEIERLRLQHSVWRPRMLDAWRRAGITTGQTVIDIGSGPGYASFDLSEIVGPGGRVVAVERSARFIEAAREGVRRRGLTNITTVEADITECEIGECFADAAWCRWVFSWLADPARGVAPIARALKPGARAVFHEYVHYGSWGLAPRSAAFAAFVAAVVESVARTGTELDSALALPALLEKAGFEVMSLLPIVDVVAPDNYVWGWPASFVRAFQARLVAEGLLAPETAREVIEALDLAEARDGTRMVTPTVLEIIARRRS